jgi:putative ABC transport system permease protein
MRHTFDERLREERGRGGGASVLLFAAREFHSVLMIGLSHRLVDVAQDVRYALRWLARSPGFSSVAVVTLALGVGANTAVFSAVNGVLLRPLPYDNPGQLIQIWEVAPQGFGMGFSPPNFVSYREEAASLTDLAAYNSQSFTLTGAGDPERIQGMNVTAGFFELLGTPLHLGRTFAPEEDLLGAEPVVILSHGMWSNRYGADPRILGNRLLLDGISHTVVGIAPRDFEFAGVRAEVFAPWAFGERDMTLRGRHWLRVVARLNPGVSLAAATDELEAIAASLAQTYPETNAGWGVMAVTLLDETVWGTRTPLLVLLGVVGLVLLIACANVSNLLLARSESRGREMAVRAALGASQSRLLLQMLTENTVLTVAGGAAGLFVAYGAVRVMVGVAGSSLPRASGVRIDVNVLAFTTLITAATALLVGIVPAIRGTRRDLISTMKEGRLLRAARRVRRGMRSALVVAEVALSLLVVVAAGLLANSFWRLTRVDPGFSSDGRFVATVSLPASRYGSPPDRAEFYSGLVDQLEQLPEVVSAGAIHVLPLAGAHSTTITVPELDNERVEVQRRHITPGYFATMGIPLLAGRDLAAADNAEAPDVVIVNESFRKRVFPNETAIGERLLWQGRADEHRLEIVGVVGDVRSFGLASASDPTIYLNNSQLYPAETMNVVVRTHGDPLAVSQAVRERVWILDPDLPLYQVTTIEQMLAESVSSERLATLLLGTFAIIALLLGTVGIYGVMSHTVSQRTHEIGVRIALGAGESSVLMLVIRQGMMLVLVGLLIGLGAALGLTRVLQSMLFDVTATDPATFLGVVILISAVAVTACYVPAKRAARVDPVEALRQE